VLGGRIARGCLDTDPHCLPEPKFAVLDLKRDILLAGDEV